MPILPRERDPRLITIRRGGTLTDEHHRLLAAWALGCAAHDLGAAAYAIRVAVARTPREDAGRARAEERHRQRERLPAAVRELVLEDQRHRSALCWHVFDD